MENRLEESFGFELRNAEVPEVLLEEYLSAQYPSFKLVFTGGSYVKNQDMEGFGFFEPDTNYRHCSRLRDCESALMAELHPILQTLGYLEQRQISNVIICTDSMRATEIIRNRIAGYARDPIVHRIVSRIKKLVMGEITLGLCGSSLIRALLVIWKQIDWQNYHCHYRVIHVR